MGKRILLVDDEPLILKGLKYTLEQEGYETDSAMDGEEALAKFDSSAFDLILLDVMLPKLDGIAVCQRIREHSDVPIIMLTAKVQEADKIRGLSIGADDYVTKPFSINELLARVEAVARRSSGSRDADSVLTQGVFTLDKKARRVTKNGKPLDLTQVEYQIIEFFFDNAGTALDRDSILNAVWGESYYGDVKIVDVNIRRLRIKVEDDPSNPVYLQTIWGFGYRWCAT